MPSSRERIITNITYMFTESAPEIETSTGTDRPWSTPSQIESESRSTVRTSFDADSEPHRLNVTYGSSMPSELSRKRKIPPPSGKHRARGMEHPGVAIII